MKFKHLICCFVLSACFVGEEVPPDQTIWDYGRPKDFAVSEDSLLSINSRLRFSQQEFEFLTGLIVIKNNHLIFENYYQATNRNSVTNLSQAGLTFSLAAIGVAADKGLISIDDPIADFLPEYSAIFQADPDKQGITIAHLLTHRSGLSWNEGIFPAISPQSDVSIMKTSDDWVRFILEKEQGPPPGLFYNLNSASGAILAKVVENASGQDYLAFLEENLLNPLTINSLTIERDSQGNYNSGNGISISLLDWTKLAYLILNEGIWEGRKIIDPNFIKDATSIQREVNGDFGVGYYWQLFGENYENRFGIDSREVFFIQGELGQHLYIIPSENMIVSIFAENFFFGFDNPSLNLFEEITYALNQ